MFGSSHEAGRVVRRSSCRPGESMKSSGVRRTAGLRLRGVAYAEPGAPGAADRATDGALVSARFPSLAAATGGRRAGASRLCSPMAPPTRASTMTPPGRTSRQAASRGAAWPAAVLLSVIALAGCSGESAPKPAPPSSSPTASDSASDEPSNAAPSPSVEEPPEMPAAAKGTSKKSAEAFVRYAVEVLNYTSQTLRRETAARRSRHEDCAGCASLAPYVEGIRAARAACVAGMWTSKRCSWLEAPHRVPVTSLIQGRGRVRSPEGAGEQ